VLGFFCETSHLHHRESEAFQVRAVALGLVCSCFEQKIRRTNCKDRVSCFNLHDLHAALRTDTIAVEIECLYSSKSVGLNRGNTRASVQQRSQQQGMTRQRAQLWLTVQICTTLQPAGIFTASLIFREKQKLQRQQQSWATQVQGSQRSKARVM
jgi:hypothetical protein